MLIVEGADLVGKTTLAKALVARLNELGWPHVYRHATKPPQPWHADPVAAYEAQTSPWSVQDRFHLSELVYRRVDGQPSVLTDALATALEEQMPYSTQLVIVCDDEGLLRERHAENAARELYGVADVVLANRYFGEYYEHGRETGLCVRTYFFHTSRHKPYVNASDPYVESLLRGYLGRLVATGFPWEGAQIP